MFVVCWMNQYHNYDSYYSTLTWLEAEASCNSKGQTLDMTYAMFCHTKKELISQSSSGIVGEMRFVGKTRLMNVSYYLNNQLVTK